MSSLKDFRRAESSAFTGPFPSPSAVISSPFTTNVTVAWVSTSTAISFHERAPLPLLCPTLTSKERRSKKLCFQPVADLINNSKEASAASKW